MMFTPHLSDMGPGGPPHSQFLPSLLSVKSGVGGSLSLKYGTANVQASMLRPRNVKNNPLQKKKKITLKPPHGSQILPCVRRQMALQGKCHSPVAA